MPTTNQALTANLAKASPANPGGFPAFQPRVFDTRPAGVSFRRDSGSIHHKILVDPYVDQTAKDLSFAAYLFVHSYHLHVRPCCAGI